MTPKEITKVEITEDVFKDPNELIKKIETHYPINYTKVIQTYVLEDRKLELVLERQGSRYLNGKIVWIGNKKDDSQGTIFCVDTRSELKQINPSPENTESVMFDIKKEMIKISTESKAKCSVCGKPIEIFDEWAGCPICESKAHKDHLVDWIKMKHSCPVCKKALNVSATGMIYYE